MSAREFPIQGGWSRRDWRSVARSSIPWAMIAPHEAQALKNHCGQNLERLAQRGGLGHCEAIALLEDREWTEMNFEESVEILARMTREWIASQPVESAR